VEWYLDAVSQEVRRAEIALRRAIASLGIAYIGLARDQVLGERRALAVWLALRVGVVTNRSYRSTADVESRTSTDDLHELVVSGHLVMLGSGRNARYVAGPKVAAWGDYEHLIDLWVAEGPEVVGRCFFGSGEDVVESPTLFEVHYQDGAEPEG
jgi:hypothetical protein